MVNTRKNKKATSKKSNGTKKQKCVYSQKVLTQKCRNFANTFNQFEVEYEKQFKKNINKELSGVENHLIKMFKTPFTLTKYTPRTDYYNWINYTWIKEQEKKTKKDKKYYVQVDNFRIVQEKVYYELIDIIEEYVSTSKSKHAVEVNDLYKSLKRLSPKASKNQINLTVDRIDGFMAKDDLYGLLAEINKNEIVSWASPVVWNVLQDQKNAKIYRSLIYPPQLTAYDYDLYFNDPGLTHDELEYRRVYKEHYMIFMHRLFEGCFGKNHGYNVNDVWDLEKEMLDAMDCQKSKLEKNYDQADVAEGYILITSSQLMKECNFDWMKMAKLIGYKNPPDKIVCTSVNYMKCIMENLLTDNNWKSPKWRTYFVYIYIKQIIRFNSDLWHIYFDFHEKFVKGQTVPLPRKIYPIFGMAFCFNTFLTNAYIDKYRRQQYIDYVHNMAADCLLVFKRILKRNTWLSPATKKQALLKLEHMQLIVGSPKKLRYDPLMDYDPLDAYGNLYKLAIWRTKEFIKIEGKEVIDVPLIDWSEFKLVGSQAYIVNAFYTATENKIYIPLAYLQQPFIDLEERGIEYNLAHIGWALTHEMSHALDNWGSKYDYKGDLHNWWTDADRRKFNLKVDDVVKQYETFAAYDGIKYDASLATGENMADISGLGILVEYLRDFQDKNKDIVPICKLSFEAFFTYIAIQNRQHIMERAIKAQLKTNPHPLDKYRTNCPLARIELFRSSYNIKKGDKMYWPNSDTIW